MKRNKKQTVGIFIRPGGNEVFFASGVLKIFNKEKIHFDHLFGYSSSAAIMFPVLSHSEDFSRDVFAKRLEKNEKDFYFFKSPHFPHHDIYKSSLASIFEKYYKKNLKHMDKYTIIASQSTTRFKRIKSLLATFFLGLEHFIGEVALTIAQKVCNIKPFVFTGNKKYSKEEVINVIMGSSTIYPMIGIHTHKRKLLLEGQLVNPKYEDYLKEYDKKIVIHRSEGKTRVEDGVLHIHPRDGTPYTMVDRLSYTDAKKVRECQRIGEAEAKRNLKLIRNYLR